MNNARSWGSCAVLAALVVGGFGCAGVRSSRAVPYGTLACSLDGDVAEWPQDAAIAGDDRFVYLRFTVQDESFTLQAANQSLAIFLDVDGSSATGHVGSSDPLNALGTDLEIVFSPAKADGTRGTGVAVSTVDAAGVRTPVPAEAFDLMVTPTYAGAWYELRLSRTPVGTVAIPSEGLRSAGGIRGVAGLLDAAGGLEAWADPFAMNLGPAAEASTRADASLPVKPAGAVRVVAYNVERNGPATSPATFERILTALNPDIVILEEWDAGTEQDLIGWFGQHVRSADAWHAAKATGSIAEGGGVAIVSRYTVEPVTSGLTIDSPQGFKPVRFIGAIVRTPTGEILAGATHLKCCGTMGSPEDQQRLLEAQAINAAILDVGRTKPKARRVIAGDLNLVGSRPPLDVLRKGLDADGTDLAVVEADVLGDRQRATWRDPKTPFTAGRLDYITYSDSNARLVNAFVFDTARLNDEALARIGLDHTDSAGSDHLPVVIDLAW